MNIKKLMLIVGSIFVLGIIALVLFGGSNEDKSEPTDLDVLPVLDQIERPTTQKGKRMVNSTQGFIEVHDVTADPVKMYDGGVYVVNETTDFSILYYVQDDFFLVSLLNSADFQTARRYAELAFLQELGVTQQEACTLAVDLVIPPYINFDRSGSYGLSFCANAQPIP